MSLNSLLVPNVYDLFCNSITTADSSDNITATRLNSDPVALSLQGGGQTIATYSVRGVNGVLPAFLPSIRYDIIKSTTPGQYATCTVTIPQFFVLTTSGSGAPQGLILSIANSSLNPLHNISFPVVIEITTGTFVIGKITLNTIGVILIQKVDETAFGAAPFGLQNDISFTYDIPNPT